MIERRNLTAGALADQLGGTLHGDPDRVVHDVAPLETAGPDDLSWVGSKDVLPRLAKSRAGVVLLPPDCEVPGGRTCIVVADPDLSLCDALRALAPPVPPVPAGVDPSARVAGDATVDGAAIGPNVVVGARAFVGPGCMVHAGVYIGPFARIGRDCVLYPNVVIREYCELGDRVIVHANATIGSDGFGYLQRGGRHVKIPQIGRVVVEDDVEIGANTCIDRARSGATRIGRGSKIDNLVQIGHNVQLGEGCIIVGQCGVSGSTELGKYVVLAGQVGVVDHVRIGDGVVVTAKSGVSGDIPPGKVYRGIPADEVAVAARQLVAVRRLPKLMEEMRGLAKRVEKLESAADDSTRS